MAISWTAKLKDINGMEQIHFTVKDSSKIIGIGGCHSINDDETTTEPIVDWLKTKLGEDQCEKYEQEAIEIDDTLPTFPQ